VQVGARASGRGRLAERSGERLCSVPTSGHAALEENSVRDVSFILLTLVIFAALARIARGVERM
jgi:hypothetical protein